MKNKKIDRQKFVSIIIRSKNEEDWIENCLKSIFLQTYKKKEVILIDNFSSDNTTKIAKKYKIKILKIKKFLPGKAINKGIKIAKGEIIVCLSAHCIPKDDKWLQNLVRPLLKDSRIKAVYGRQEPYSYSSALDKRDLLTTFGLDRVIQKKDPFFHNANSAFLKKIWQKFPFDEKVSNVEDRLWGKILIDNNYCIQYEPDASVFHWHGINHSQNQQRAEAIIEILENKNSFFSYQSKKLKSKNQKGIAIIPIKSEDFINFNELDKTLLHLVEINEIVKIYVSTDDKKIYQHSIKKGFNAILRPKILINNYTDIFDVAKHTINDDIKSFKSIDFVLILQIDYPNRNSFILKKLISLYKKSIYNAVVSAKIESRSYKILKSKNSKIQRNQANLIPQNLKEDKLVIYLTGLGTIIEINSLLNETWRNNPIDYLEVDEIYSIKLKNKNKL